LKLESELEARQKSELEAFRPFRIEPSSVPPTLAEAEEVQGNDFDKTDDIKKSIVTAVTNELIEIVTSSAPGTPKVSRARRRREKKEAEERDKQKRVDAESSVLLEGSQMKIEDDVFEQMMKDLKLEIIDILPDGNW